MSDQAMVPEPTVLATKLHAPRRRSVVDRPRLQARVASGQLPALVLVSAPAGFGKTTLVADWFVNNRPAHWRTAWLSLDPTDDDPASFWAGVVAALRTVAPGAGADARSLLQAAQPVETVARSLLHDLAALASPTDPASPADPGQETILVLDDYHVIDSAEIHAGIAFLVDHLPPNVHLVLAGRADPPLPLARLRAAGELLEIRAADLRFTPAEAAAYLNEVMGLALAESDVAALEARTEGWIAALQLAALSMEGRDDPAAFVAGFAGDDRFVVDYLAEEVLERQPAEVRRFLLHTAVLPRLTGPLCDAVTGTAGGRAMLERLDRANLFLVPLDDRRRWYRYHHLFGDVLQARLLDEDPGLLDELHQRAAAWFEAEGELPEAITHALAGHDTERAARLIELAMPALFRSRQELTARRWLTALPAELFADRPVLAIEAVGAIMVSGELTGVEQLLAGIEPWLEPGADLTRAVVFNHAELAHLPAQVAVYRAALALIGGDLDATIGHAERALALAPPTDHLRRGSAAALVGLARWTEGDLATAEARYTDAVGSLTAAGHISDVLGCSLALADIQTARGRLVDAIATLQAGLDLARANNVVRGTADLHAALCESLLDQGDRPGAARHLDAARALGETAGLPQHPYRWRVAAARLHLADGDGPAALALLDEAVGRYHTDMSPPVRPAAAVRARAHLAIGDVAAARRWARDSGLTVDDELSYVREYEHVTLAQLLRAEGATADAAALLDRLAAAAEATGRPGGTVVELEPAEAGRRGDSPLVDPLSSRELDVLRLLRSDLGGPEIARELHVSLNTLRTHTQRIYTKLGVRNRREAVRRAAELGL